jgi:heme exporter protein C
MFKYANPAHFMRLSGTVLPYASVACIISFTVGLFLAFRVPPDYQQGMTVMILFVHVPADMVMVNAYLAIAVASFFSIVWRHPLADVAARTAAPLGALFTLLALITGSLWGKPMWGTYWAWDPRLVTTLLQLFLYLAYIALWNAFDDEARAARAASMLALVSVVNLPIMHFSVDWWNSLHQANSLSSDDIAAVFRWPLFIMFAAYGLLFLILWTIRIRTEIVNRRIRTLMQASP